MRSLVVVFCLLVLPAGASSQQPIEPGVPFPMEALPQAFMLTESLRGLQGEIRGQAIGGPGARIAPEVFQGVTAGDAPVPVLVHLALPGDGRRPSFAREPEAYRRAVREAQDRVLKALAGPAFRLENRYRNVPGLAGSVNLDGLAALAAHPLVRAVVPDREMQPMLAEGCALMRVESARAYGLTGAGQTVVVADTGVDLSHPDFAAVPTINGYDFGDDDADASDDCACGGHGTAVAGIIASPGGVAPGAGIAAVKVSRCSDCAIMGSAFVAATDWAITNQAAYNITALNASFGTTLGWAGGCDADDPVSEAAAANAMAAGIAVFAAAGNDANPNSVGHPACLPSVISVGAVYDADVGSQSFPNCDDPSTEADQVTCYSNSAPDLDLLAPSHCARTTERSQGYGAAACFGGTSAASPYAAGAAVLLRQAYSWVAPAGLRLLMAETGDPVMDPKSVRITPRINLEAAFRRGPDSPMPRDTRFVPQTLLPSDDGSYTLAWMLHPQSAGYDIYRGTLQRPWAYDYEELACNLPAWKWWLEGIPRSEGRSLWYLAVPHSIGGRTAGRDSTDAQRPLPAPCPGPDCQRPNCTARTRGDGALVLYPGYSSFWLAGVPATQHYWATVDFDYILGDVVPGTAIAITRSLLFLGEENRQGFLLYTASDNALLVRARLLEFDPASLGPVVVNENYSIPAGDAVLALVSADAEFPFVASLSSSSAGATPFQGVILLNYLYHDGSRWYRSLVLGNTDTAAKEVNLQVRGAGGLRGSLISQGSETLPAWTDGWYTGGPFDNDEPWSWFDMMVRGAADPTSPFVGWSEAHAYDGVDWYDTIYAENTGATTVTAEGSVWLFDECCH